MGDLRFGGDEGGLLYGGVSLLINHRTAGESYNKVTCMYHTAGPQRRSASTKNMTSSIYTDYPPALLPVQQEYLVTTTKDWAIQNGLAVRPAPSALPEGADSNRVLATNAPVTLFPSPFPRTCFEEAQALQTVYNKLYAVITCNEEWLGKVMEEYETNPPELAPLELKFTPCAG